MRQVAEHLVWRVAGDRSMHTALGGEEEERMWQEVQRHFGTSPQNEQML